MKEQIKQLRVEIDGISQLVKELKPFKEEVENEFSMVLHRNSNIVRTIKFENSDEINKCYDSLILAKAWLGKILGELGVSSPYKKDGNRHSIEDIEKTADIHKGIDHLLEKGNWNTDYNYIEKIDWLRQEIKTLIDSTEDFSQTLSNIELEQGFTYKYLSESRFWLGFELQRIKENK